MSPEDLALLTAAMAARHTANTTGPGSILDKRDQYVDQYAPFDWDDYAHADVLKGRGPSSQLLGMRQMPPGSLWYPDPFESSPYRTGGMRAWDAAVGIPMAKMRGKETLPAAAQAMRRCNRAWISDMVPAIQAIHDDAPLIVPGFIDLRALPKGWDYLRAAHILAHMRAPGRAFEGAKFDYGRTSSLLRISLAEVMFGVMYNLPINTQPKDPREYGGPNAMFGVRLETCPRLDFANLRVPFNTAASPVPDKTLLYVLCAMNTAPNPYLFRDPGFVPADHHAWSGMPTVVAFAGWEGVDTVCHQRLCRADADKDSPGKPLEYIMPADDLLPAADLRPLLQLAEMRMGWAGLGDAWQRVDVWMQSDAYKKLEAITPPLPCLECAYYRMNAIDAPKRPAGKPDEPRHEAEWRTYNEELLAILAISQDRAAKVEAAKAGIPRRTRDRERKACSIAYRRLVKADAEIARLTELSRIADSGRGLSEAAKKLYTAGVAKYGEAFVASLGGTN